MVPQLFVIFVLIYTTFASEINETCVTPNKENATCIPFQSCTVIFEAVKRKTKDAIEFAKLSKCGVQGKKILVCCGSTASLKTDEEEEEEYDYASLLEDTPTTETPTTQTPTTVRSTLAPFIDFGTSELPDRSIGGQVREKPRIFGANFESKVLPNTTICGLVKEENRIFGGKMAELGEFPWVAALMYEVKYSGQDAGNRCAGSLINNKHVLTAAHCMLHVEFKIISVWLGEWNLSTDPDCKTLVANMECADPVQKFEISALLPHPFYSQKSGENDIGLLRLKNEIIFTGYIRPICLSLSNLPFADVGVFLTVVDWGDTENGTSSDILLKVKVPVVSNDVCKEKLPGIFHTLVASQNLCAGDEPGKDNCQDGAPLMRIYEDKSSGQSHWYLVGIAFRGVPCRHRSRSEYPVLYTRVSGYVNWILTVISNE